MLQFAAADREAPPAKRMRLAAAGLKIDAGATGGFTLDLSSPVAPRALARLSSPAAAQQLARLSCVFGTHHPAPPPAPRKQPVPEHILRERRSPTPRGLDFGSSGSVSPQPSESIDGPSDVPSYLCRYPGCGKSYASTDAVRKHCRQNHLGWLRALGQGFPGLYCRREINGVPAPESPFLAEEGSVSDGESAPTVTVAEASSSASPHVSRAGSEAGDDDGCASRIAAPLSLPFTLPASCVVKRKSRTKGAAVDAATAGESPRPILAQKVRQLSQEQLAAAAAAVQQAAATQQAVARGHGLKLAPATARTTSVLTSAESFCFWSAVEGLGALSSAARETEAEADMRATDAETASVSGDEADAYSLATDGCGILDEEAAAASALLSGSLLGPCGSGSGDGAWQTSSTGLHSHTVKSRGGRPAIGKGLAQRAARRSRVRRWRSARCGSCTACHAEDCGECRNCKDMPKFGGTGGRKQACVQRVCTQPRVADPEAALMMASSEIGVLAA